MWVLGLYKLSWPANGSFVYAIIFFFFFFFFLLFLFCFLFFEGEDRNVKGERGSWGGSWGGGGGGEGVEEVT